jgi:hypothetical protein
MNFSHRVLPQHDRPAATVRRPSAAAATAAAASDGDSDDDEKYPCDEVAPASARWTPPTHAAVAAATSSSYAHVFGGGVAAAVSIMAPCGSIWDAGPMGLDGMSPLASLTMETAMPARELVVALNRPTAVARLPAIADKPEESRAASSAALHVSAAAAVAVPASKPANTPTFAFSFADDSDEDIPDTRDARLRTMVGADASPSLIRPVRDRTPPASRSSPAAQRRRTALVASPMVAVCDAFTLLFSARPGDRQSFLARLF